MGISVFVHHNRSDGSTHKNAGFVQYVPPTYGDWDTWERGTKVKLTSLARSPVHLVPRFIMVIFFMQRGRRTVSTSCRLCRISGRCEETDRKHRHQQERIRHASGTWCGSRPVRAYAPIFAVCPCVSILWFSNQSFETLYKRLLSVLRHVLEYCCSTILVRGRYHVLRCV